jgi:hypothetical protein
MAMASPRRKDEEYRCSIVNHSVTVKYITVVVPVSFDGITSRELAPARQMKGCDFAHECKKFAALPFETTAQTECPFHESLKRVVKPST